MAAAPETVAALEALLFAYGEPLAEGKLSELLGVSVAAIGEAADALDAALGAGDRGLALSRTERGMQLVTKSAHARAVAALLREELAQELTPAALETLALVAYFGPISRSRIEHVRGVNSSFTLRNLLVRGLIERAPASRGTYEYRPAPALFRELGIGDQGALPEFAELSALMATTGETPSAP